MADISIFTRLKRLFSNDVIIRNVGGKQLKIMDTGRIQKYGNLATNSLYDRFTRMHKPVGSSLQYNPTLNYQSMRLQLYSDYEAMDHDPIIASALDIISDETTTRNEYGDVLKVNSSDENVRKVLHNLFYDVLNIEFNLATWVRNMCKYGDFYLKMEVSEKFGVYNVIPLSVYEVVREEGTDPENPSYTRFTMDPNGLASGATNTIRRDQFTLENYEVAHFRLLTDSNYLPYGRSYLEPGRKLFKQYSLMEDAMLIHRIARAPEKRVFYMNVGAIPPNEIEAFMQKTISQMKRTPYMDENTGEYNLKYNMQNMLEDFYIPVRGNDTTTRIDTTKGLDYDGIQDVEYLRNKLFAALKIPKAFLGYDENVEGKATLAAEDIRFARTIDRIQRIILSELNKIALVHLYTQGYTDEKLTNFTLEMTTPSIIYEQEKIELLKSKAELSAQLLEQKLVPSDWIYDNLYHFSEGETEEYRDLVREDSKRQFRNAQIEAEGNDPVSTGKSYGTPHDLASLYGNGRMYSNPGGVPKPEKYAADDPKLGRPKKQSTKRNTQDDNFGKDRLGTKRMKDTDKNDGNSLNPKTKGGSLALESARITFLKNKDIFKSLNTLNKKKLIFEEDKDDSNLLDDSQLKG